MHDHQTPATAAARGAAVAGTDPRAGTEAGASPAGPRPRRRNKSGAIGTATETAVVRYLNANGWPGAERRRLKGTHDQGDVTGCPGICWEIKGGEAARRASDSVIAGWLMDTETERVNARADIGILVVARSGIGPANAYYWWAIMPMWVAAYLREAADTRFNEVGMPYAGTYALAATDPSTPWEHLTVRMLLGHAVTLLRAAGYGTPEDAP